MVQGIESFFHLPISLSKLELLLIDLPQKSSFRSAIGIRKSRQALIVRWTNKDGLQGYGECSCRPDPFYSAEFLEGVALVIQRFLFPLIKEAKNYGEVINNMSKVRGWPFAKASIEFAAHHLLSQQHGKTIYDYWDRPVLNKVPVGISIGIQENLAQLKLTIQKGIEANYHRLKFKIHPQFPPDQIHTLSKYIGEAYLSFDANGSFASDNPKALAPFLDFNTPIEQPFPPHRIDLYRKAIQELPNLTVCLDEEVKSLGHLIQAHQLNSIDELNIKPGRVGGIVNSIRIADYCFNNGIPCWVGGMFETGIGRSQNLQFAARLNAPAHDLSPSSRYFERDLLENPLQMDAEGYILLKDAQNATVNTNTLDEVTTQKIELINS
ncbi:MAG: o-succinylbenzoate synthase [Chitinophagales bacterium]|nr:o-succinylbenzoate synthase [Chitinophagales bacterium]